MPRQVYGICIDMCIDMCIGTCTFAPVRTAGRRELRGQDKPDDATGNERQADIYWQDWTETMAEVQLCVQSCECGKNSCRQAAGYGATPRFGRLSAGARVRTQMSAHAHLRTTDVYSCVCRHVYRHVYGHVYGGSFANESRQMCRRVYEQ